MSQKTVDTVALFLSELLGTALLIFLGCMGCISWGPGTNSTLQMCLSFGLVVMIIIQIFGCVSGAHLNPAVTIAAVIYDLIDVKTAVVYIIAQMLGSFMGYGLLIVVTPENIIYPEDATGPGLCSTVPRPDLTPVQAVAIEYLSTTVLILICCGVWDPRNAQHQDSIPLKFGLAITAIGCIVGPYTGASMNPARSLGPALWNNDFHMHWIYWAGPLPAAVITAIVYKSVFRREPAKATSAMTSVVTEADRKVNNTDNIPLKAVV